MDMSASTSTMLSSPSSDPASTLRAAALLTLKAKRRKPAPEKPAAPTLPRPPPPADLFPLDYGQEDIIPDSPMAETKRLDIPSVDKPPPLAIKVVSAAEDPNREEGEISEEEGPPPPAKAPPPVRKPSRSPGPTQEHVGLTKSRSPSPLETAAPQPNFCSPEVQSPLVPMDGSSDPFPSMPILNLDEDVVMGQVSVDSAASPSFFRLGPENVRPGLSATQAEYDTIKEIILDLLGWGVLFDDLVGAGLSKEVIYYVFNELNLQLPDAFDATGIVPYTPETFFQMSRLAMLPGTELSGIRSSVEPDSPAVAPSIRPTTPPAPIKTFDGSLNEDLHDMERRRRQELMARKAAVQASRKSKPSFGSSTGVPQPEPLSMDSEDVVTTPIASEMVEDFLKSLAPVTKLQHSPIVPVSPPTALLDRNEVDRETVITFPSDRESQSQSPGPITLTSTTSAHLEPQDASPPPSSAEAPPTSVGSSITTFSRSSGSDTDLVTPSDVPQPINIPAQRRGTKRPVASDFVDFDPTPRKNEINSRQDRSNGLVHPAGPVRRLTGTSFHNIGGSRRCVIDLSDSEDDGDIFQPQPVVDDQIWIRRDRQNNAVHYPSPAPSAKPLSTFGTMSPATLMQKELEIRKMRELIARREEETRLRKLALASSATSSEVTTPSASGRLTVLKQEEGHATISSQTSIPTGMIGTTAALPLLEPSLTPWEDSTMTTLPGFSKPSKTPAVPSIPSVAGGGRMQDPAFQEQDGQVVDWQMVQAQQAAEERAVDVDPSSSPSAQMTSIMTPLQKQDDKSQDSVDSSGLNNNSEDTSDFSAYRSPFESFPGLRGDSRGMLLSDPVSSLSSSSASHMYPSTRSSLSSNSYSMFAERSTPLHSSSSFSDVLLPDLKPLKLAAQVKSLDPFKPLCQYEVPGGGTCRDDGCNDIHLSKLEGANQMGLVEPTDQDTAEYLFKVMPSQWLAERQIDSPSRISSTLQHARQRTADNPLRYEERVAQVLMALGPPAT